MSQEILEFAKKRVLDAQHSLLLAEEDLKRVEQAFAEPVRPSGPFAKHEGALFFLESRSGGHGHFLRVKDGYVECSCPASTYGRKCWAINRISWNLQIGDTSWTYAGSAEEHRNRVRPRNAPAYRPQFVAASI